MKTDRKKEFFSVYYSIAELKTLETHFSHMAANGWLIDKIGIFSREYRKIEPKELVFIVDLLPGITAFDYPNNRDAQEYRQICEQSGWTFVTHSKQIQVFYAEKKNELPMPIHTDRKIEAKNMVKVFLKYEFFFFLYGFLCLLFLWNRTIANGYNLFLSNSNMSLALLTVIMTITSLCYFTFAIPWLIKMIICIKKDLPLPQVSYKTSKLRIRFTSIASFTSVLVMVLGFMVDIYFGLPKILIVTFILPLLAFGAGLFIRKQVDTKERSRTANKFFLVFMVAIILVGSISGTILVIVGLGKSSAEQRTLPENRQALRLSDIGEYASPEYYDYFGIGSIIFPLNYTYYEGTANADVSTRLKKSVSSFFARKIYEETLNEFYASEFLKVYKMTQHEAESFGALEGYFINDSKTYFLLLYEKSVLIIDYRCKEDLDESLKQKIALIGQ